MTKIRNLKLTCFGHLGLAFGIYLGFGIWELEFYFYDRYERYTMTPREIKKLDTRIQTIKKAAQELKALSDRIPAVDRNVVRILASVKMLEINISDVKDLL